MQVITPQSGTELMPVDASTAPPGVEAFYSRAARQHVTWLSAVSCQATGRTHVLHSSGSSVSATEYSSSNWSGYVVGGGTTATIDYVQSGWYVPTVTASAYAADTASSGRYNSATWVGLGGISGGYSNVELSTAHPLIQGGTEQDIASNGSPNYYFWVEIVPGQADPTIGNSELEIKTLSVKPGDQVGAVITYLPSAQEGGMGVCNWTTNQCVNFIAPSIGAPGNTAEWIMEAPTDTNGATAPLANFGSVNFFNGCWAYTTSFSTNISTNVPNPYPLKGSSGVTGSITGTCQTISQGPNVSPFEMYLPSNSNTILAVPGSLGSNGSDFQVNYQ